MSFKRHLIIPLLAVTALLSAAATVSAQEGVELKPAVIEERVEPGSVRTFSIKVTNISDTQKTFYLNAQDITGLDDAGLPIFSDETEITPYELSQWIEIPESAVTLGARETKEVSFTVRVPAEASPGAHFGGVFLDARPPRLRSNGSSIGLRVGTIINLRIAGNATEDAQMREFSTSKIIYGSPNVEFNVKIANLGNVLLRPHGLVEISDMRGAKVGLVKINNSGAAVFPNAEKTFAETWNHEGFAFGRYQAVVSLVYGEDGRKTVSGVTSFWVLPFKPILIALGSIFAVILLMYAFIRMYISRKLREMGARGGSVYSRRNQNVVPRLLMVALTLVFFSIVFLIILFLMFA